MIGYSQALIPRAEARTGQISFFPASSGLLHCEPEFKSISELPPVSRHANCLSHIGFTKLVSSEKNTNKG